MSTKYCQARQSALNRQKMQLQQQLKKIISIINKYKINHPLNLCSLTVSQAIDKLNKNLINSEMLVACLAFMTGTVGKQLNLFTLTNFSQALQLARKCDQTRKQTGKKNWTFDDYEKKQEQFLPPLYGIPISIKDVYDMKSFPTTIGLTSRLQDSQQQSPLITCFKNSGLIPFVRSNVPQYCMSAETNNQLWGRSVSPWNRKRSVGGSSGGEGGLISARCSILGVGSDIGGSLRVPADHCGIFALKPHSKRISNTYHAQISKVVTAISNSTPLCIGCMAKSTKDLALFMKVVTHQPYYNQRYDPYTSIIRFDDSRHLNFIKQKKRLRIGYINQLQCAEPSPASRRALDQVKQILKNLGHQLVQIKVPNENQLIRQYLLQINASKGVYLRQILKNQQPTIENKSVIEIQQMGFIKRFFMKQYAKYYLKKAYFYSFSRQLSTIMDYQEHIGIISQLKRKWIQYWRSQKLDFAICIGFPCQAIPHGQSNNLGYVLGYTFIWNILDMVVGSLPVTVVKQHEQYYQSRHQDMFTKKLKQCASQSAGLPVGVQIVGLPYQQEEVLGLMSIIQQQINFYKSHPLPSVGPNPYQRVIYEID